VAPRDFEYLLTRKCKEKTMKIVPIAAILIGALGSVANAQSAVSNVPAFNLAMNTVVASQWVPAKAPKTSTPRVQIVDSKSLAAEYRQNLAKQLDANADQISLELAKKLAAATIN
jgi:hypothetical protein